MIPSAGLPHDKLLVSQKWAPSGLSCPACAVQWLMFFLGFGGLRTKRVSSIKGLVLLRGFRVACAQQTGERSNRPAEPKQFNSASQNS